MKLLMIAIGAILMAAYFLTPEAKAKTPAEKMEEDPAWKGYWAQLPKASEAPPPEAVPPPEPSPPIAEAGPPNAGEPAPIDRPPPVIGRQRRAIRHYAPYPPYPLPPRQDWGPPPPLEPILFGFRRWRYPPPYWRGYPYGWRGWRHEHHGWRSSRFHHR